jgi:Tfp pilus assembly protein PilP
MNKILILILSLVLIGCGASYEKEESSYVEESEEMYYFMEPEEPIPPIEWDSTIIIHEIEESARLEVSVEVDLKKDSVEKDSLDNKSQKRDTIKRKVDKREKLEISPIDTTSVLPDIRKNRKMVEDQQQLLDSLLRDKKK